MTRISRRLIAAAGAGTLAMGVTTPAHGAAFYLQEQSARAAGRAFSGEAADLGSSSLWWNPAAIGGLSGGEISLSLSEIMPKAKVVDNGSVLVRPGQAPAPIGGDSVATNPISNGTLPSGSVAYGFGKFAVGLAVTSPFSFETDYEANSWVRYTADKTKLTTIDVQPSVAFAISPQFVVGVAANAEHSKATLGNYLPNLSPLLPDGHQTLEGKGWDWGWSAGAQFRSGPAVFGLSYKSSIRHKLKGGVTTEGLLGPLAGSNGTIPTSAAFRTPWQAVGSVRFQVSPQLTLDGQIARIGWKKFDAISLLAPLNAAIPQNYRNTWSVAGGVDYQLSPQMTVRAGIQRDQTPTRDGSRDARVPDSNRWDFAVGGSFAASKSFTIDAAAMYIDFANASIDRPIAAFAGTPVQTPILPNGELRSAHALVLSLGARMGF
jgi:long-chain fatty acid transport protein